MEHLFVYDIIESSETNEILLFGLQRDRNSCWRVTGIPQAIFYLQLQKHIVDIDWSTIKAECVKYIPYLGEADFTVIPRIIEKEVCPVISFAPGDGTLEEDLPTCWNDDIHKTILIPEMRLQEVSPIHKADACKIRVIEIHIQRILPVRLRSLQISHHKIHKQYLGVEIFSAFWKETLSPLEIFSLKTGFRNIGWVEANSANLIVPEQKILASYEDDEKKVVSLMEFQVLMNCVTPSDLEPEDLKLCFIDGAIGISGKFTLSLLLADWAVGDPNFNFTKHAIQTFTYNPTLRDKQPDAFPIYGHVKTFGHAVRNFLLKTGVQILVPFRWSNFLRQKMVGQFKIFPHLLKPIPGMKDRGGGMIIINPNDCFENDNPSLLPPQPSYQLSHLASRLLERSYKPRILDPEQRIEIVAELFSKFSILPILFEWADVAQCPLQTICNLKITKINEWCVLRRFFERNFIIRQISVPSANSFQKIELKKDEEKLNEYQFADHGGLQIEPEKDVHPFVFELDFASDYPSIIKAANLCFSSLTLGALKSMHPDDVQPFYFQLYAEAEKKFGAGEEALAAISQSLAVLPSLCMDIWIERKNIKKQLGAETDDDEKKMLEVRSQVRKFTLNSIYGACNFPEWRFYCPALQEYIAALGRMKLCKTKSLIETRGFTDFPVKIVAGHTDSLFARASEDLIREAWDKEKQQLNVRKMKLLLQDTANQIILKVDEAFPGTKLELDDVFAAYAPISKNVYLAIRLDPEAKEIFSEDQCVWKGITQEKAGVPFFIAKLRSKILLDAVFFTVSKRLAFLFQFDPTTPVKKTANQLFSLNLNPDLELNMDLIKQMEGHISAFTLRIIKGEISPREFIFTGQFHKDLCLYPKEGAPMQVEVARCLERLAKQNDPLGEFVAQGDTIEMIVCHDFTKYDDRQPVPAHFLLSTPRLCPYDINVAFYLERLVDALDETLSNFSFYSKERLQNFILKLVEKLEHE